jgi:hypothetical protein
VCRIYLCVTFLFPPVETKFEIAPEHFGSPVAAPP